MGFLKKKWLKLMSKRKTKVNVSIMSTKLIVQLTFQIPFRYSFPFLLPPISPQPARSLWSWSGQRPTTQSPPFSISHLSPRSPFPARLTPSCRSPGRRSRLLVPRRRKVGLLDPKSLIHRRRKLNIGVMHLFAFIQHHLIFQGRHAATTHKRRHRQGNHSWRKRPQL